MDGKPKKREKINMKTLATIIFVQLLIIQLFFFIKNMGIQTSESIMEFSDRVGWKSEAVIGDNGASNKHGTSSKIIYSPIDNIL